MKHITVWDLPLRIFHWALVGLVIAATVSAKLGGNALEWHTRFGLAILALLVFRIIWGFVGGTHAKFSSFIRSPKTIIAYLKGKTDKPLGHNPIGALSVIAILAILIAQAVTGLFSNDDIMTEGPLYALVSKDTSDYLTHLHTWNQYVIYGFLALHVGAILYYRLFKKEDLVKPMVTGRKQVSASIAEFYTSSVGNVYSGLVTFTASSAFVWFIASYWK